MKKSVFALLNCGILLCVSCASLPAQNAAPSLPEAVENVRVFEWKGKYPTGAELLKLERENVAQNAEFLAKLRQTLAEESLYQMAAPRVFTSRETIEKGELSPLEKQDWETRTKTRETARLLRRESNVRLADGDAVGAMQSRIDAFRLAQLMAFQGHFVSSLVANAVEAIAWSEIEPILSKLDGAQALEAFRAIETVRKSEPTWAQIMENEKQSSLLQLDVYHPNRETFLQYLEPKDRPKFAQISKEQIAQNYVRLFDAISAQGEKPYAQWQPIRLENLDPFTEISVETMSAKGTFFLRARTQNHTALTQAALLQRAKNAGAISDEEFQKLLPLDPFGTGKLRIKSEKIYSVGPDGKDDGATAIAPKRFDFDAASGRFVRIKNPRVVVTMDSKGDILAP